MQNRPDRGNLEHDSAADDRRPADGREVIPIQGWWWIANGGLVAVAWLAANLAYGISAAAGGDAGYSGSSWQTYVRYPVEDFVLDGPLIAVGAIPVLLVAWYSRKEWASWKERGLILAASFLVPVPHLFVTGDLAVMKEPRNLIWFGVFVLLAGVLVHPQPEGAEDGGSSSVQRLQDWGATRRPRPAP